MKLNTSIYPFTTVLKEARLDVKSYRSKWITDEIVSVDIICYIGKLYAFCDLCALYQLYLPATLVHNKSRYVTYPLQT